MSDDAPGVTEDRLHGGRVRLLQRAKGHRAGTDAVLLAASAPLSPGQTVCDVGAATGAVGLMAAARVPVRLVLVERDPDLADLARRNLALNGRDGEAAVADILDPASRRAAGLRPGAADCVLTNPPYLEEGRARLSPDPGRAAAHALPAEGLAAWIRACGAMLKPGGHLVLVHRADRLAGCLAALEGRFGALALRFVHPRADEPAARLLVRAVKGSRAPLTVLPPLVLHEADGRFTPLAEALHRGEADLA
ncbi:MAG TPA: methyltransferase [Microvirga sp.]|jgi:tRNA1(Val) A37 N6-methylase TrmN6|nr:methyltransferase [Microvirga sp.]